MIRASIISSVSIQNYSPKTIQSKDVAGTSGVAMNHNLSAENSTAILVKRHVKFKKPGKRKMLGWQLEFWKDLHK